MLPKQEIEDIKLGLSMSVLSAPRLEFIILRLIDSLEQQEKRTKELENGITNFVDKNFGGGAKSSREDYVSMVSCKDIYDLRELIRKDQ